MNYFEIMIEELTGFNCTNWNTFQIELKVTLIDRSIFMDHHTSEYSELQYFWRLLSNSFTL